MNGSVSRSAKMEACAVRRCVVHYSPLRRTREVADPRRNETTGQLKKSPSPMYGLLRPAVSAIRMWGAVFANGNCRP